MSSDFSGSGRIYRIRGSTHALLLARNREESELLGRPVLITDTLDAALRAALAPEERLPVVGPSSTPPVRRRRLAG